MECFFRSLDLFLIQTANEGKKAKCDRGIFTIRLLKYLNLPAPAQNFPVECKQSNLGVWH